MSSKRPLPTLSSRLERLLQLCRKGGTLWDIGCDHGRAGAKAAQTRDWSRVEFVDPSDRVIALLKDYIGAHIPPGIEYSIHHKKAEQLNVHSSPNTYLMAGFGGQQIIASMRHLTSLPANQDACFVLSPHRDWLKVRQYLQHNAFHLVTEEILQEEQQFYPVIVIENRPGEPVSLYGEAWWQSHEGGLWRHQLLQKLSIHQCEEDKALLKFLASR